MGKVILGSRVHSISISRVNKKEQNKDLYYYEIRHSDGDFIKPATLEKQVQVNYLATLVTFEPINFSGKGYVELGKEEQDKINSII